MKTFVSLAAGAMLLAACAAPKAGSPEAASLPAQNAVYVVGENPAASEAMPQDAMGDDLSVVKRVYWYFAGR